MYIRPEIQELARLSLEKQAALNAFYRVGKKVIPTLWNAAKAAPVAAAKGAKNVAMFPVNSTVDAVKSVPQVAGVAGAAIPKSFNPSKAYKHVADHYGQGRGFKHGTRNFIKDVAGVRPYSVEQNRSGVVRDLGRALWNPRIPTVRRNTAFNPQPFTKGIGSGQDVGKPIFAAGLAGGAYGAGKAIDNAIVNAPITGNPKLDRQIPIENRRKFTRTMAYKSIPKVLWSGLISGNQVDRKAISTLLGQLTRQSVRGGLSQMESRSTGVPTLKKLLNNQVLSNTAAVIKKPDVLPSAKMLATAIQKDVNRGQEYKKELENSAIAAAIQQGLVDLEVPEAYEEGKQQYQKGKKQYDGFNRAYEDPSEALKSELIENRPELEAIIQKRIAERRKERKDPRVI